LLYNILWWSFIAHRRNGVLRRLILVAYFHGEKIVANQGQIAAQESGKRLLCDPKQVDIGHGLTNCETG
jgi:hypothetical protein